MSRIKFFAGLLVFSFVLALFTGCSNSDSESDASNKASSEPSATASETPKESEKPKWQTEKFTLKYASMGDEKFENKMFQAFMEKYPNITVVKDKSIVDPFETSLANAAAAGSLPDVFYLKDVPTAVQNDWLMDISPYWDADPETQTVYKQTAAAMVYNGKRMAAPTFQYVYGVYLNKTLFEKNNVPLPSYNWTIDQMVELAKKLSKPNQNYYGIAGAWGDLMFNNFFPMQNDASLGVNTYDGEKYHFTNQDWINGYNLKLELRRLKVEDVMTGKEKKKVFGDENAWTFQKGHVAMQIDGSWNVGWLPGDMKKAGAGELDFYPFPGGKAGQRLPTSTDFIGVASTTKYPEAAYELSKFMTWGKEGWLKQIDIMKELGTTFDKFPVSDQPEVYAKLEKELTLRGMKAVLKLMPEAVMEPSIPGYTDLVTWDTDQKFTEKLNSGEYKVADKVKEYEDKANEFVANATAKLDIKH